MNLNENILRVKELMGINHLVDDNKDEQNLSESSWGDSDWGSFVKFLLEVFSAGLTPVLVYIAYVIIKLIGTSIKAAFDDIKHLISPDKVDRFVKIINKDDEFNKEVIQLLSETKGGNKMPILLAKRIVKLPSFQKLYDKFAEENNMNPYDKIIILNSMTEAIKNSFEYNAKKIIKRLMRQYPEIVKGKNLGE